MVHSNMRAVQFTRTAIHVTGPWQLQSAQLRPPDAVLSRGQPAGSMRFLEHGRTSSGAGNSPHSFCPSYCSVGRIHRSGLNSKVVKPMSSTCDRLGRNAPQDYIGENSVSDSRTFVQLPRCCDDACACRHRMVRKGHQCSHSDSPLHMFPSSPKSPGSRVSCQQMCRNNLSSKIKSVHNPHSDYLNPEVSATNIRKIHFSSDSSVFSDRKKYGGISFGTRYTINVAENSAMNPYINEFHPSLSSTGRCNYVQRRHQSSLPLSGSSGVTADDKQQDWTTLGAREYGKSIRVLREPVTVTTAQIKQHLTSCNVRFEQGHTCFVTTCPRLKKKLPVEEMEKLYINMTTGWFVCHSCQKAGSWTQLQDNLAMLKGARRRKDQCCLPELEGDYNVSTSPQMSALWQSSLPLSDKDEALDSLLHSAGLQNLSVKTLQTYGVRLDKSQDSISLLVPIYFVEKKLHAVKRVFVKSTEDGTPKALRETVLPRGEVSGVVGWQTVTTDTTEVVLTASEFDAMAVYQSTRLPAIALPKGDSTLPQEILPMLEQFKKIVLWFKNDIRSWEIAKQFTKKLSQKRCFVIRPSEDQPSALEALQRGVDLSKILSQARSVSHQSITAFSQLRHEVFSELAHVEQVAGVKWKRYPQLNRLLKGHRRGELTIFTGPTGSGKTTFISDYSLDLCMQGVNTLWGSFEINNVRLMKMMLTQFAQQNLTKHLTTFDHWADQFESLPMYFMTFFGQESIKKVIETMSHAVYVHDIAHVVVDNLQFMMGVENDRQPMDRFQRQDLIVAAFRKFATTMNCHVTVVVHPRKEKETEELTTASVYGSAKATQEADNVMILQDKRLLSVRGKKYLQISKNRFDGELGVMLLKFDKESLSFAIKQQKTKDEKTPVEDAEGLADRQTGEQTDTQTGVSLVED